jgi:hypothetical protein
LRILKDCDEINLIEALMPVCGSGALGIGLK